MKDLKMSFASRVRLYRGALIAMLLVGSVVQSEGTNYALTNNNSVININAAGSDQMNLWLVDGVSQLNQSAFYYRVGGMTNEAPIVNIAAPSSITYLNINPTLSQFRATYDNLSYSVQTSYQLTGGSAGSGGSQLNETITVANETASSLDFYLYEYSDFDLAGLTGNQSVQFYQNNVNNQYSKVVQTLAGVSTVTEKITSASPPIGYFDAATYNSTFASLNDNGLTTLGDNSYAGVGNVTFAYEWVVTLAPSGQAGSTFQISKLLAIAPVPEPSSVTLILSGGLVLLALWHRRRRQAA